MLFSTAAEKRPYHLGTYPLEALPRDDSLLAIEAARAPVRSPVFDAPARGPLARVLREYLEIFVAQSGGDPTTPRAPVPDDPERRMIDVKGYAYFMNASQVGICRIPGSAWTIDGSREEHAYAVVLLLEHARAPEHDNLAREWIEPACGDAAASRIGGIAVCLEGHIRKLGFAARAHVTGAGSLDPERLAVLAGLAVRDGERLRNPYIGGGFSLAVVSTEYVLEVDRPLARRALGAAGARYWLGINGATSGRERARRARRPTHLGGYPMETVERVDRPTTLILDGEVPRVPKRASFFDRALAGDLGAKAQHERSRFAFKQPHTSAMMGAMRTMVPLQGGEPDAGAERARYRDRAANARALKSLAYFLGADIAGICEVPRYAWYSHDGKGRPLEKKHRYAVVMLIDQEFETMEGASGDDWISGTQSMRAYLRGAEIAGVMADLVRKLGFPARSQTNVDSDVLHIPLVLWAGLGELSRIGELVLNPFVGPRVKTVVMTTDMPLEPDRPIDFGLQYFCDHCVKCARECPCDAISWGDKVVFNGYAMWKLDVERCARYRLTNAKGSACGRCMKTCPLNKVVTADGPLLERLASWCGINARWLEPLLVPVAVRLDDLLGKGRRNPVKKWWLDLEVVDGVCVEPVKGVNRRELRLDHAIDPRRQKIAYYHANAMPVPNDLRPQPVDRKRALAAAALVEAPTGAVARAARGAPTPAHHVARAPHPDGPIDAGSASAAYGSGADGRREPPPNRPR